MSILKNIKLSSFQIIILGFAGVVFLGAFLLMLPISSNAGCFTPFNEAIFTSTSAVCVTGLVVQDTATYWSLFGQSVILLLIQIGGLGVITVAASFALLSGRRISLKQRHTMQEAFSSHQVGGIVRLTGFVLKVTFAIELIGALIMMPTFCTEYGVRGIWLSFFHSISAFCNAGFDLLGTEDCKFASLTSFQSDPIINITVILLIVIGGIGFLTWEDIKQNKHHITRYRLQSKVILTTTAILIAVVTVIYYVFEYKELPAAQRFLTSLFQAVTPRTAGFNTADLTMLSGGGMVIMIILMLIGGSPGSTAGGMKTTTAALLFLNAISVFRKKEDTEVYGRRIESGIVKNASAILMMYISLFLGSAIIISCVESLPIKDCLFETASAIGTVGLSMGITPSLGIASQVILMVLMFFGRVGGLTLIYATFSRSGKKILKYPKERITVG